MIVIFHFYLYQQGIIFRWLIKTQIFLILLLIRQVSNFFYFRKALFILIHSIFIWLINCIAVINMQSKDIDIHEFLEVLSLKCKRSSTMSYQISEDYQPNNKCSIEQSDHEELTFDLISEDKDLEDHNVKSVELKKIEQGSHGKLPSMFRIFQDQQSQNEEKGSIQNQKSYSEKKKNSMKAIKQLRNKMFHNEEDIFSKKYIDLFDQFFFKKQQNKEKKIDLHRLNRQESLISNNQQQLSIDRSRQENSLFNSQDIDNNHIASDITKYTHKIQVPKIVITYKNQNEVKALSGLKMDNFINPNSRIKINFMYGQSQKNISSSKQILVNSIDKEKNVSPFNKNNKNIATYPNFYNRNNLNSFIFYKISQQYQQMIVSCKESIHTLLQVYSKLNELIKNTQQISQRLQNFDTNILQTFEVISYILAHDWPSYIYCHQMQLIRPEQCFIYRQFQERVFLNSLKNCKELLMGMQAEPRLNILYPQSLKRYFKCRQQLWKIQEFIKFSSEDLYCFALSHFNFSSHFLQFFNYLKETQKINQRISFNPNIIKRLLLLKKQNNIVCNDWLCQN